jgi:hypothetical protein
MFNDIDKEDVVAAGELRKEGPNVTFNLQSGSFMEQVYSRGGQAALEIPNQLAVQKFRSIGLTPIFNEAPMINAAPILTRPENYEALKGFFESNVRSRLSPPKKKKRNIDFGGGVPPLKFGGGSRNSRRRCRRTRRRHQTRRVR